VIRLEFQSASAAVFKRDLSERLNVIEIAADHFDGIDELQHLLEGLLAFLLANEQFRSEAVHQFRSIASDWRAGAVEVLEFTMRSLRWDEVRRALEGTVSDAPDFRVRDLARQALEVYGTEWPGGEIYRHYRDPLDP
jgi:putative protein kinase ArgK-like GTPase of G3E family